MNRQEKEKEIQELHALFAGAKHAYVTEYRGLTVEQMTTLRRKVRATRSSYRVVKNTLAARAVEGTPLEPLKTHFTGPVGIAVNATDPVGLAKALRDFAKEAPTLTIRTGVVDGKPVTASDVQTIASMPSREELLGKLAYLLAHPIQSMANVLNAPLVTMGLAFGALKNQKSSSSS